MRSGSLVGLTIALARDGESSSDRRLEFLTATWVKNSPGLDHRRQHRQECLRPRLTLSSFGFSLLFEALLPAARGYTGGIVLVAWVATGGGNFWFLLGKPSKLEDRNSKIETRKRSRFEIRRARGFTTESPPRRASTENVRGTRRLRGEVSGQRVFECGGDARRPRDKYSSGERAWDGLG